MRRRRIGHAVEDGSARWTTGHEWEHPLERAQGHQIVQVGNQGGGAQSDAAGNLTLAMAAVRGRFEHAGGLFHLGQLFAQQEIRLALEERVNREELGGDVLCHRPVGSEPAQVRGDAAAHEVRPGLFLA